MKQATSLRHMPLWKWILLLVGGLLLTVFAQAFASSLSGVTEDPYSLAGLFLLASAALIGIYLGSVSLFGRRNAQEIQPTIGVANGFVFGSLFIGTVTLILWFFGCYKIESTYFNFAYILLAVAQMLMIACGEEIIFRGVLFRFIDERFGLWPALIVSAAVFGGSHLLTTGATLQGAAFIAIEAGLLLGIAYKRTGNLWFPIGIHWGWNLTLGPVLGLAVSGGNEMYSIITPVVSGPEILTGGDFGPEASIVAAAFGILAFLLLYWNYRKINSSTTQQ